MLPHFMIEKGNWPWSQAWTQKNQNSMLTPELILKTMCFSTLGTILRWKM